MKVKKRDFQHSPDKVFGFLKTNTQEVVEIIDGKGRVIGKVVNSSFPTEPVNNEESDHMQNTNLLLTERVEELISLVKEALGKY